MYKYWAGTEASYETTMQAMARGEELTMKIAMGDGSVNHGLPPIWGKQDGLAVLDINGGLVAGSSGYGRLFGAIGYDDIQSALVEALSDPEVNSILFNISSPGGDSAGCQDLAQVIAKYSKLKPMVSYTGEIMASAGYWIGSATGTVIANQTALVGSIGVVAMLMERSKMLEANGITVNVLRSVPFKALGNPNEPLTEEARAALMENIMAMDAVFTKAVADNRGVSVSDVKANFGLGRTFVGKAALTAGLVDKIGSYDQAISIAKGLDKNDKTRNNSAQSKGKSMKALLSAQDIAKLAAGASLAEVTGEAEGADDEATKAKLLEEAAAEAKKLQDEADATAAAKAKEEADAAATLAANKKDEPSAVAVLQAQVDALNGKLIAAGVEAAQMKANADKYAASFEPLLKIARAAVDKMTIALGGTAGTMDASEASAVIAKYAEVESTFNTKFKVGGVAKPTMDAAGKDGNKNNPTPVFLATINATKPQVK